MSAGEVTDAAVEAGWAVAPHGVGPGTVRDIIEAALPHLSPRPDAEVCTCTPDQFAANQWHHFEECPLAPAPAPVDTLVEHAKACGGCHRCDFVPAPVDDREALAEWSESDRSDVSAWLIREADQRVKFFPQRRDSVDSLLRHLAGYVKGP